MNVEEAGSINRVARGLVRLVHEQPLVSGLSKEAYEGMEGRSDGCFRGRSLRLRQPMARHYYYLI